MICQFSFQNFRSYKNETVFDMQATSAPEMSDSLIIADGGSPILPISVVYGPNGGGKSNLIKAFSALISMVVRPIHELKKNQNPIILQYQSPCVPFAFDETSEDNVTEFLLYFRTRSHEYQYYISVLRDAVISESLHYKPVGGRMSKLFEREDGKITLGAKIRKAGVNTDINVKMPYLSFLAINHNFPAIVEAQRWFESCVILNYANPSTEQMLLLSEDPEFKNHIIQLLNDMGIDVTSYRFDEQLGQFFLTHQIRGKDYELNLGNESEGTQKLFSVLPIVLLALAQGRPLVIDELDSKLHPKLLKYIISLFKNPAVNRYGAQLIFSSHDMTTMRNDVFRRDEIWFASLTENRDSEIYSLYEIRREGGQRINNDAAYNIQYMAGRYGADPYLRAMLDWEAL